MQHQSSYVCKHTLWFHKWLAAVPRMASMQEWGGRTLQVAGKGVDMTASLSQVIIPDAGVLTRPDRGAPTPARVVDSNVPTAPTAGGPILRPA